MDMFEPQVHPDVFPVPGGPPTPPYDNAGWTLAYQMGVEFDRILDGFTGPFETIAAWNIKAPAATVTGPANARAFVISRDHNDAFVAANRLIKAGEEVHRLTAPITVGNKTYAPGSFLVRARSTTRPLVERMAADLGVAVEGLATRPAITTPRMRAVRVGLWDQYGGSMPSGWTRWIMEQFEIPFERVFAQQLDAGNLDQRFDVLVFVDGALPAAGGGGRGAGAADPMPADLPDEYKPHWGRVSVERTLPQLKSFMERGGTVIAIGSSAANLAEYLNVGVTNHLVENGTPLPRTKLYVPGSVVRARVDTTHAVAHGIPGYVDMFFDDSPVFRIAPNTPNVTRIAWFDSKTPLRSGWAWGQDYLENGAVAVEAKIGRGHALLYGPEILQRAQPHGTFKFLFNGIYSSVR
jgi:hypothetical protein